MEAPPGLKLEPKRFKDASRRVEASTEIVKGNTELGITDHQNGGRKHLKGESANQ